MYIKSLQAGVEEIYARASDEHLKKSLKDLADTIRYSDPLSAPQLSAIEDEIAAKVTMLGERAASGDTAKAAELCDELQRLMAERNMKCKALK
jgi:hypothetical protein